MRQRRPVSAALAFAFVALLALPAIASANPPGATADFEARVTAQNKDLYSFTIDYDHIEYIPSAHAGKPLMSEAYDDASAGWSTGDHNVTVTNSGALPFELMVQASSEPTATDGFVQYTVPLATNSDDYYSHHYITTASGGAGKASWYFVRQGVASGDAYVDGVSSLGIVDEDDDATLESYFIAPYHWPHGTALDYNWGGTLIAAPADPV